MCFKSLAGNKEFTPQSYSLFPHMEVTALRAEVAFLKKLKALKLKQRT